MNIEGKLVKLDETIRNYVNHILIQQKDLINENNQLKKEIYKLQGQINTINHTLHSIELAFLGNKAIYDELIEDFNNEKKQDNNEEDEFLHLSNKQQLKKIRETD